MFSSVTSADIRTNVRRSVGTISCVTDAVIESQIDTAAPNRLTRLPGGQTGLDARVPGGLKL